MDKAKVKRIIVSGDKKITARGKVNKKGFFKDRFGNKIYLTNSKKNKERLAELNKPTKKKKPVTKKPIKRRRKKKI